MCTPSQVSYELVREVLLGHPVNPVLVSQILEKFGVRSCHDLMSLLLSCEPLKPTIAAQAESVLSKLDVQHQTNFFKIITDAQRN